MAHKTKTINVREYRRSNQNGQSSETGNIGYTRRRKTTQYVLDTTIHTQKQIMQIRHEPAEHQHPFMLHFEIFLQYSKLFSSFALHM